MATQPDFTAGQVITAAQMNKIGSSLISETTVGAAVSSVTVSSAFSSDYDNYRIIVDGVDCSATGNNISLQLGGATTAYYYSGIFTTLAAGPTRHAGTNVAIFVLARSDTANGSFFVADVLNPNLGDRVMLTASGGGNAESYHITGFQQSGGTVYTAFTLLVSSGTMTGGKIRVYGYRGA